MAEQTQTRPPEMSPTHNLPPPYGAGAGYHLDSLIPYNVPIPASNYKPANQSGGGRSYGLSDLIKADHLPVPNADPATAFIFDRLSVESFAVGDLVDRIRERVLLYRQHMDELQQSGLNAVAVRRDWRNPLDNHPYLGDPDLLQEIQRIDSEKRSERLTLWRDMNELRTKLPEQWLSYLTGYRRYALFSGSGERAKHLNESTPQYDNTGSLTSTTITELSKHDNHVRPAVNIPGAGGWDHA